MKFIEQLQKKPVTTRKKILWAIMIIVGVLLALAWLLIMSENIKTLGSENIIDNLNIPEL